MQLLATIIKVLVPVLWLAATVGGAYLGHENYLDDPLKGALIGGAVAFFGYLFAGLGLLMFLARDAGKENEEKPQEKKDRGMTLVTWLAVAGMVSVLLTAGAQFMFEEWVPQPSITAMPTDCVQVLRTLGMDPAVKCPTNRQEWRVLIATKVTPFVSQTVWDKELENALLAESCPEMRAKVQGIAPCQLNAGKFALAYSKYLDEKNEVLSRRWSLQGTEWIFIIAAILAVLNFFLPAIAIAKIARKPKLPLGKITATTIFAVAVVAVLVVHPLIPLFGSSQLSKALWQLFWLGFAWPIFIVVVGGLTFGAGKLVSELTSKRNGATFAMGLLLTIAALLITVGSEMLGLIPSWGQLFGIVQIMNENPGMTLATAVQFVFLGGVAFSGLVGGLIGPFWTIVSTMVTAIKNHEAMEKVFP